jgi:hypothetical protein
MGWLNTWLKTVKPGPTQANWWRAIKKPPLGEKRLRDWDLPVELNRSGGI